ncbi:MAG: ZIP family metal transporter [Flavobacteriaceae bacterium]
MTQLILFFSVLFGALIVYSLPIKESRIRILLSFSGAYLLSVTVLHLFPEFYAESVPYQGVWILAGILTQSILEFFSQGAEHGHIHNLKSQKFPWLLFIGLSLHAFFEGVPVAHAEDESLLSAIVIHKIPIAMVLTSFLMHSKLSKTKAMLFIVIFALMSPLGSYLSGHITFFSNFKVQIDGFIIGVFLHISTIILFESSQNHRFNLIKFLSILLGFALAFWA